MRNRASIEENEKMKIILEIPITTIANHIEKGMIVKHKKHGLVYITGGAYMGTCGISNFFHWSKILSDGTLDKKDYHGYDNKNEFEIKRSRL